MKEHTHKKMDNYTIKSTSTNDAYTGWLFERNREIGKYTKITQTTCTIGLEHAVWYCVYWMYSTSGLCYYSACPYFPISLFLSDSQPEKCSRYVCSK